MTAEGMQLWQCLWETCGLQEVFHAEPFDCLDTLPQKSSRESPELVPLTFNGKNELRPSIDRILRVLSSTYETGSETKAPETPEELCMLSRESW